MKPFSSRGIARLAGVWAVPVGWHLLAATLYVSPDSLDPEPPYATWGAATRVIQDAVDAAGALRCV